MLKTSLILLLNIFVSFNCIAEENEIKSGKLKIVSENSLYDLLKNANSKSKHEASGVVVANSKIYIVFDNYNEIARIDFNLKKAELLGDNDKNIGYEGITFNSVDNEFYLVEEALKNDGAFNARLRIMSDNFTLKNKKWFKYNFQSKNKGFEGITFVIKENKYYILALCEGNDCESGSVSKIHGAGRIKVFMKKQNKFKYIASIRLPNKLPFIDYSGMDINDSNMLAITSQESSAVWIAKIDIENWQIVDDGVIYKFPIDKNGNNVYCNIEGVAWISKDQIVTVSDAKKDTQAERCKNKEQSIHIMAL